MRKLLKGHVVDMYEIFSTPRQERRNINADLIIEPMIVELNRLAILNIHEKRDREEYGFTTTGIFSKPYDLLNFAEEDEKIIGLMKDQAKKDRKSKFLQKCKVYRDSREDYLVSYVRLDMLEILYPCDLPGKAYSDADYRGTALCFKRDLVVLCDFDYDKAANLFLLEDDLIDYQKLNNESES
jgi:hypothetical protein